MKFTKIFASSVATLDSNVYEGGGTDVTAALQRVLDKAGEDQGIHLIMDGAALITGLDLKSNTTVECLSKDCGFFLKDGSDRSLIDLKERSYTKLLTRNVSLIGGTYNHNNKGQQHHVPITEEKYRFGIEGISDDFGAYRMVVAFEFFGVQDLIMRDITIRNQRAWSVMCVNFKNVTIENIYIDLPDWMRGQNQDGFHFWGPGQFLTMRNIKGRSGDDFIALGPDEHDLVSSITDVLIDGVHLDYADQAIRMLCRSKGHLDRVTVRNVTGTYRSYGFFINPWFPGDGFGNYGHITFENIDLRPMDHVYPYRTATLFDIGGNFDCITFKNIHHQNPSDNRPLWVFGLPFHENDLNYAPDCRPHIKNVVIDGLTVIQAASDPKVDGYIHVYDRVENLFLKNVIVSSDEGAVKTDAFITFRKFKNCERYGAIGNLVTHDIYMPDVENLTDNPSQVECMCDT
ncbi:MAG TPA: hypothetical protein PLZ06_06815 [Clostridia bacterium]|jgi:hypothetical protein|nr:hypothetical protein [Clostridia bacterium]HQC68386.1 hypothetical protein [Clostridia bacterium]